MVNYRDIFSSLARRAALALALLVFGAFVIKKGLGFGSFLAAPFLLFGMAMFVVVAILMGMPLARLVAEFIGNIFYWSEHYDKPQPVYGIPEAKRLKGLFQEAFDCLQELLQEHPQEIKAYVEMIDIAIVDMKNPDLASKIYHRGMDVLKKESARNTLAKYYKEKRQQQSFGPDRVLLDVDKPFSK